MVVVSRRGRGGLARLDSPPPINRYAGDWSVCGRDLLLGQDADYDEVAGSESERGKLQKTFLTSQWTIVFIQRVQSLNISSFTNRNES